VILLGIVAAGLVIFTIVEMAAGPAATPYGTFLDQLDAGNVASVTLQGTEIKGRYKQPLNAAATEAAQANTFRSRVPDFGDSSLIPAHVIIILDAPARGHSSADAAFPRFHSHCRHRQARTRRKGAIWLCHADASDAGNDWPCVGPI
jgi:hypothetical protein